MKRILFAPDGGVALAPPERKDPPAAPAPVPAPAPEKKEPAPSPEPTPAPEPEPSDDPFERKKPATPAPAPATDKKPAAPAPAPEPDLDNPKLAPKELREHAKRMKEENKSFAGKIATLEERIAFLDKRGIDSTALTAQLQAVEKARDAALAELRAAKQEASPEFKEKYDKPFNLTAERTKRQISELTITDAESGAVRAATWQDFAALYALPTGKAIEQANTLFGASANFVIQKLEALHEMDEVRRNALEEERTQFKERTNREIAEGAKHRESVAKLWDETNTRLATTNPEYKNEPEDTEANEARKHALEVFDTSIDTTDRETFIKQKVLKDAHVRQKVGAYAVQKIVIARQKDQIEKLQKQIDELKGLGPEDGKRQTGVDEGEANEGDWGSGLIKHVSKA